MIFGIYFLTVNFRKNKIKNQNPKERIAKCGNINCSAFFSIDIENVLKEQDHLCDNCKANALHSHLVQCENCQSILNFIPLFKNEEPIVYYVKKCSNCYGTVNDEKKLIANHFPESYI